MNENTKSIVGTDTFDPTRREAIEAIGRVSLYVAPATLMLVSSVSAAGSVQ